MLKIWYYFLGLVTEGFALLVCLILFPFRAKKLDVPAAGQFPLCHILCVHGYLHNDTAWIWFKRQLRKAGLGSVNGVNYHSIRKDIPAGSLEVKKRVEEYKQATGHNINVLIGHSEGGLVSLEYALEFAPKDQLTYVITLASPLNGSTMTKYGIGPGVKQMEIGSPYLQHLHERLLKAEHIRLLAIATTEDFITVPWESAFFKKWKYAEHIELTKTGHAALLFSPRAVTCVIEFLKSRIPA